MARTEGVEPTLTVLETVALPLNYIRIWCSRRDSNSYAIKHQLLRLTCLPLPSQEHILEELTGFEPAMTVLQTISLTCLDTTPPEGWLGQDVWIRTRACRSQSPVPYRLGYVLIKMVVSAGIEPALQEFSVLCSTR